MISEVFTSWRNFNPIKVASLLRQHNLLLSSELRAIEVLLASPTETNLTIAAERTRRLRAQYRIALKNNIEASRAMRRSLVFQNFLKFINVINAQAELLRTSSAVFDLLARQQALLPENPPHCFRAPVNEPSIDVDFESLERFMARLNREGFP